MKLVNKLQKLATISSFSAVRFGGTSFRITENPLTEDTTHTSHKWQIQDQNPGLLLPVIVLDAVGSSGLYSVLGPCLPGIPGLAGKETTGTDFHTRWDVINA